MANLPLGSQSHLYGLSFQFAERVLVEVAESKLLRS